MNDTKIIDQQTFDELTKLIEARRVLTTQMNRLTSKKNMSMAVYTKLSSARAALSEKIDAITAR